MYNAAGRLIAHTTGAALPGAPGLPAGSAAPARQRRAPCSAAADLHHPAAGPAAGGRGRDTAAGRPPAGVVVLARSTAELDDRLAVMWGVLAPIGRRPRPGAVGAVWVWRWAGRPLWAVDAAASSWARARWTRGRPPGGVRPSTPPASTFNTMAARLEALIHGNRAMVADVSHQLRTPLPRCDCGWTCSRRTPTKHGGGIGRRPRGGRPAVPAVRRAACGRPRGERRTAAVPVRIGEAVADRVAAGTRWRRTVQQAFRFRARPLRARLGAATWSRCSTT